MMSSSRGTVAYLFELEKKKNAKKLKGKKKEKCRKIMNAYVKMTISRREQKKKKIEKHEKINI